MFFETETIFVIDLQPNSSLFLNFTFYPKVTLTIKLVTQTTIKNANCNNHIFLFGFTKTLNTISMTVNINNNSINAPHVNKAFSSLGFSITNQATRHALAIFSGVKRTIN
ncbi:hypothetical protein HMPREF3127_05765 [Sphingobacterium sp. HMSC13C05]|nr:hypothetical protein HMPREF3127_05765 [Sphingobacterium sp. HMSC13C05]